MKDRDIGKQSLRDIVGSIKPGQLWAVIVALGALLSGAFALGDRLNQRSGSEDKELVSCLKADGYPKGEWLASGEVTSTLGVPSAHKIATDPAIYFRESKSGTWVTNETMEQRTFELDRPLESNQKVLITFTAKGDHGQPDYTSKFNPTVSPCGCLMTGPFEDSVGHRGAATYFWHGRDRYWVTKFPR